MVANRGHAVSPSPEPAGADPVGDAPEAVFSATSIGLPEGRAPHLPAFDPRDPKLAAYIGQMTLELSAMARAAGFDLLAYFLDMARIEANIQSGKEG